MADKNDEIKNEQNISRSKQKRMEQESARRAGRAKKAMARVWSVLIPLAIIAAIVVYVIMKQAAVVDYSRYLTDAGMIKGVGDSDVSFDYKALTLNKSDLLPDDETVQADINEFLSEYEALSEDVSKVSVSGDKVNVSYTSVMDGEEYDASEDTGEDMTIGDAVISETFDAALTGRSKGETFNVDVTFPEDDEDEERAGKTASYTVTLNGIYELPELTDEFVSANSSGYATVDEYRQSIIDGYVEENKESVLNDTISENTLINKYPSAYMKNLEKVLNAGYESQMNQYNSYFGQEMYSEAYELLDCNSPAEYKEELSSQAKQQTERSMALEYVFKAEGMTCTEEDIDAFYTEQGYGAAELEAFADEYGRGYLVQAVVEKMAFDYLLENVTINE
ncbi:MAG: hypothetical protein IKQ88_03140 [Lachnospiraceae bacterium]|nr:hypothetical protein [Lachnospiraceae bacterium]